MKSSLQILGIFLFVATLMPISVCLWNYFPSNSEKINGQSVQQIEKQIHEIDVKNAPLVSYLEKANAKGDSNEITDAQIQFLLKGIPKDGLEYRIGSLRHSILEAEKKRSDTRKICIWVMIPLGIFTLLSFCLAKFAVSKNRI